MPVLHVVMPTYNEHATLEECLERVLAVSLPQGWRLRLVLVDDHSRDDAWANTSGCVRQLAGRGHDIEVHRHDVNRGKGAAVQTGFDALLEADLSDDDLVIIQDTDLEYDPGDFPALMRPLLGGEADVVIGTRWGGHYDIAGVKRRAHAFGNRALSAMSNMMTGYRLTDMECCYKVLAISTLRRVRPMLTESRFGIEPQLVAACSRLRLRVAEVPVHYDPRGTEAGKKIGWKDGVRALWVIGRERLRGRPREEPTSG